MIKKIDFGKTNLKDLYQVFKFTSEEELNNKKSRLFPNGNTDNEVSTTSIFLASLSAVKEYREELFREIGISDIITILNFLVSNPKQSPIKLKKEVLIYFIGLGHI